MHRRLAVVLVLVLVLAPAVLAGCEPRRQYECRLILSRLDEAEAATSFVQNAAPTVLNVFAMQASRSEAASRWVTSATIARDDLQPQIKALGDDLLRHARASRRADDARIGLGLRIPDGGLGLDAGLWPLESRETSPLLDDAQALNARCGFFLADPGADYAECKALSALLARFLAPDEAAIASAHIDDCLLELSNIHSTDARVEKAIRTSESFIRPIASGAGRTITVSAARMVEELKTLVSALGEQRSAADAVKRDAAKIRETCQGAGAGSTRGPS
jgi:hypothetical protein